MNKLMAQIAKFGVVGVICFFIDYFLYILLNFLFKKAGIAASFPQYYLISQGISFIVSMIINYLLSIKYVFSRREDMSRQKEFVIFAVLSAIGLVINEICLFIGIDLIYGHWAFLQRIMGQSAAETFFKLGATGIVMVYNFISRKMFLEKKTS